MITTYNITRVVVTRVHMVKVKDNTSQDPMEYSEKVLRIETEEGNEVELILHADSAESLKFLDWSEPDWIRPKLYKGKEE